MSNTDDYADELAARERKIADSLTAISLVFNRLARKAVAGLLFGEIAQGFREEAVHEAAGVPREERG